MVNGEIDLYAEYTGLRQTYNLQFGEVRDFDPSLMYEAIAKKEVDVICAFATDNRIASYNLKLLKDDRQFLNAKEILYMEN